MWAKGKAGPKPSASALLVGRLHKGGRRAGEHPNPRLPGSGAQAAGRGNPGVSRQQCRGAGSTVAQEREGLVTRSHPGDKPWLPK